MPGHLARWISERPELIEKLKTRPLLSRILDGVRYPEQESEDKQWNEIISRLSE